MHTPFTCACYNVRTYICRKYDFSTHARLFAQAPMLRNILGAKCRRSRMDRKRYAAAQHFEYNIHTKKTVVPQEVALMAYVICWTEWGDGMKTMTLKSGSINRNTNSVCALTQIPIQSSAKLVAILLTILVGRMLSFARCKVRKRINKH